MKRMILTGILALAAGASGLLAQGQQKQGGGQPPLVPNTKSRGESDAVIAMAQAANSGNPDNTIKAAEDLITKYADTFFKETALLMEAQAYQQKGDPDKAQIIGERVLEVNPKSFQATLMLGDLLSSRTRENDLDREEKFAKATKYLNDTIDNMKTAPKPNPQITDQQWEAGKKQIAAQVHNDFGLMALTRKKYDDAVTEFKTAVDLDPQQAYQVRLASAYQNAGKNDEALAIVDKLLADPSLHPAIKNAAMQVKNAATAAKK